ncbi:N-acylneuraminate cytidylyltransferase [Phlebotomus argentipes]|uniref:N-acylneuraminate cytidylyltransferase n=1 Tax=Phlebotomus argentipes TaxID=94469 RepID=UPI0028932861|nr:N-acylneuraminate cytidylyltransferase [Phlebotomus argentipes]
MQLRIVVKCLIGVLVIVHNAIGLSEQQCSADVAKRKVVALILARGGSKGIPLKNLAILQGESLLLRALRVVKNSKIFSEIWVSTDNDLIALEARTVSKIFVHHRPESEALDTTSSIESVQEFLHHHPEIENVALIQCTSIFLRETYLELAYELFQKSDCVFTVTKSHKLRWKFSNSQLLPINFDPTKRPRRQDWDGELLETGMFYFATRNLLDRGVFQTNSCGFVEIPSQDALEIDKKSDLQLAQCLLELY